MNILNKRYFDGVFDVSEQCGFLPHVDPLVRLPDEYEALQNVIDRMPITLPDSKAGLLAIEDAIVPAVLAIPDYSNLVATVTDPMLLQALFRSYSFVTSAYLLEPSYQYFKKNNVYGKARVIVPSNIAVPFVAVSQKLDVYPWLDYHYAYSLGNYYKLDKDADLSWQNLGMCAKFSGSTNETGFIMLHVDINRYGKCLIASIKKILSGQVLHGLTECLDAMIKINDVRKQMWKASNYVNYNDFRIFIMGITGNTEIFDKGVIYDGCFDNVPQKFRGQTGSQDDIIPTMDILTGLTRYYLNNVLTQFLLDMRQYRPKVVQQFLTDLAEDCADIYTVFCNAGAPAMCKLLQIVEQIYLFRNGHWQFVQKYIMSNTKYAIATGGTPITTWIPNQIEACLKYMNVILSYLSKMDPDSLNTDIDMTEYTRIRGQYNNYVKILVRQIEELKKTNYDAKLVYDLNDTSKEF